MHSGTAFEYNFQQKAIIKFTLQHVAIKNINSLLTFINTILLNRNVTWFNFRSIVFFCIRNLKKKKKKYHWNNIQLSAFLCMSVLHMLISPKAAHTAENHWTHPSTIDRQLVVTRSSRFVCLQQDGGTWRVNCIRGFVCAIYRSRCVRDDLVAIHVRLPSNHQKNNKMKM